MEDIFENNRYVRYIAIFQNWRKEAGASFDHLHKQLVALDEWGVSLQRELDMANKTQHLQRAAANYAATTTM
jgi:galactose-1-phosphate uridylyltransferase